METLKSYLESMFAKMPNTEEIRKAKGELWQMMEDKYNELISDGKNENEAVGTVISEFGNIEELSSILGLKEELYTAPAQDAKENRRMLTFEEVRRYLDEKTRHSLLIALGVLLCICSVIGPIITDAATIPEAIGVTVMMGMIAAAVGLFIYSSTMMGKWDFLKKEPCMLNFESVEYVRDEKNRYRKTYAIRQTIGIILCVLCWLPAAILDDISFTRALNFDGASILFVLVGIGVFIIIFNNGINGSFDMLLKLNDEKLVSGNYVSEQKEVRYINDTAARIMDIYWPTITCVYLCWSFLTFHWHITWVIWPIAGIVRGILNTCLSEKN